MTAVLRTGLALLVGLLVANVLVSVWAFIAVASIWPDLAVRPDGTIPFPAGDHPAYLVEMAMNVPVATLSAYVCARIARRRQGLHVAALGLVLLGFSAAYVTGAAGAEFGAAKPLWAHAGTALGLIVGLSLGAWWAQRRDGRATPGSLG